MTRLKKQRLKKKKKFKERVGIVKFLRNRFLPISSVDYSHIIHTLHLPYLYNVIIKPPTLLAVPFHTLYKKKKKEYIGEKSHYNTPYTPRKFRFFLFCIFLRIALMRIILVAASLDTDNDINLWEISSSCSLIIICWWCFIPSSMCIILYGHQKVIS